jgi:hypothetical protein
VLAFAGGKSLERVLDLLPSRGRVVYPNGIEPQPRQRQTLRMTGDDAAAGPRQFAQLRRQFDRGRVRLPIAATYPLAQGRSCASPAGRRAHPGADRPAYSAMTSHRP